MRCNLFAWTLGGEQTQRMVARRSIASVALVGAMFVGAGSASAVTPAGHVTCTSVFGWTTSSPSLSNTGTTKFKVKGQGWFWDCDNSGNTGDPIFWGYFKIGGSHTAPNTCANADAFGYTLKLKVQWHTALNVYNTSAFVANSNGTFGNHQFAYNQLFTTTWAPPFGGGALAVNLNNASSPITLNGTGLYPNAILGASQCSAGTYNQFFFYLPGQVSF